MPQPSSPRESHSSKFTPICAIIGATGTRTAVEVGWHFCDGADPWGQIDCRGFWVLEYSCPVFSWEGLHEYLTFSFAYALDTLIVSCASSALCPALRLRHFHAQNDPNLRIRSASRPCRSSRHRSLHGHGQHVTADCAFMYYGTGRMDTARFTARRYGPLS